MFLRARFLWWPLHPLGYATVQSWGMANLWCCLFVAWACKAVILRYSGCNAYRRLSGTCVRRLYLGQPLEYFRHSNHYLFIPIFPLIYGYISLWGKAPAQPSRFRYCFTISIPTRSLYAVWMRSVTGPGTLPSPIVEPLTENTEQRQKLVEVTKASSAV